MFYPSQLLLFTENMVLIRCSVAVPNYSQSILDLCLDVTISAINFMKTLDALVFLGNSRDRIGPTWLPNWLCAGWNSKHDERRFKYLTRQVKIAGYACSITRETENRWKATEDSRPKYQLQGDRLRVKGLILDKIVELSSGLDGSPGSVVEGRSGEGNYLYQAAKSSKKHRDSITLSLFSLSCRISEPELIQKRFESFNLQFWWGHMDSIERRSGINPNMTMFSWFERNEKFRLCGGELRQRQEIVGALANFRHLRLSTKPSVYEAQVFCNAIQSTRNEHAVNGHAQGPYGLGRPSGQSR
jgi:hypothetical protein